MHLSAVVLVTVVSSFNSVWVFRRDAQCPSVWVQTHCCGQRCARSTVTLAAGTDPVVLYRGCSKQLPALSVSVVLAESAACVRGHQLSCTQPYSMYSLCTQYEPTSKASATPYDI